MRLTCNKCGIFFFRKKRKKRTGRPNARNYRTYCSVLCHRMSQAASSLKECIHCGVFYKSLRREQIYCSRSCYFSRHKVVPPLEIYGEDMEFMRIYRQHKKIRELMCEQ